MEEESLGHWIQILSCVILASAAASGAPIPIRVSESLEWTTRNSDLIILGHPLKVSPGGMLSANSRFPEDVTVTVEKVLRGDLSTNSLTFRWMTDRSGSMQHEVDLTLEKNVTYDRPQLFFLYTPLNALNGGDGQAEWMLRRNILIKQSSQGLRTANGDLAKTAEEILKAVQGEVSYIRNNHLHLPPAAEPDTFDRTPMLAQDSSPYISPRGSVVMKLVPEEYVIVPAYPQHQQRALGLCESSDYRERERGAYMLRSYPDDTSIHMLISLLKDEEPYRWNMSSDTACAVYLVRVAAYDTLRDIGVSVKKPLLEECHKR